MSKEKITCPGDERDLYRKWLLSISATVSDAFFEPNRAGGSNFSALTRARLATGLDHADFVKKPNPMQAGKSSTSSAFIKGAGVNSKRVRDVSEDRRHKKGGGFLPWRSDLAPGQA